LPRDLFGSAALACFGDEMTPQSLRSLYAGDDADQIGVEQLDQPGRPLRLFASLPAYAESERKRVGHALAQLNAAFAGKVQLLPFGPGIETASGYDPALGAADCDAVIAVLRPRFADDPQTPEQAGSRGGAAGLVSAMDKRSGGAGLPDVYIFRYAESPEQAANDTDWQSGKRAFEAWFRARGGQVLAFDDFSSLDGFGGSLDERLLSWLTRLGFEPTPAADVVGFEPEVVEETALQGPVEEMAPAEEPPEALAGPDESAESPIAEFADPAVDLAVPEAQPETVTFPFEPLPVFGETREAVRQDRFRRLTNFLSRRQASQPSADETVTPEAAEAIATSLTETDELAVFPDVADEEVTEAPEPAPTEVVAEVLAKEVAAPAPADEPSPAPEVDLAEILESEPAEIVAAAPGEDAETLAAVDEPVPAPEIDFAEAPDVASDEPDAEPAAEDAGAAMEAVAAEADVEIIPEIVPEAADALIAREEAPAIHEAAAEQAEEVPEAVSAAPETTAEAEAEPALPAEIELVDAFEAASAEPERDEEPVAELAGEPVLDTLEHIDETAAEPVEAPLPESPAPLPEPYPEHREERMATAQVIPLRPERERVVVPVAAPVSWWWAVVLAMTGVTVASVIGAVVASRHERAAVLQADHAQQTLAQATDTAGNLVFDLSAEARRVGGAISEGSTTILDRAKKLHGALLVDGPFKSAELLAQAKSQSDAADALYKQNKTAEAVAGAAEAQKLFLTLTDADPSQIEWQKQLAASGEKLGDFLIAQNNLTEALGAYRDAMAIYKMLNLKDPGSAEIRRLLSGEQQKVGDVLVVKGRLEDGLAVYREAVAIRKTLALSDANNSDRQRDLLQIDNKIADALSAQNHLDDALAIYREALALAGKMSLMNPADPNWRQAAALTDDKIGDVLVGKDRIDDALAAYRDALATIKDVAANDPNNGEWQRGIAATHQKIGDAFVTESHFESALASYRDELAVLQAQLAKDPANPTWRHGVSETHLRIGTVMFNQNNIDGALAAHRDSLSIMKALAAEDPGNSRIQGGAGDRGGDGNKGAQ